MSIRNCTEDEENIIVSSGISFIDDLSLGLSGSRQNPIVLGEDNSGAFNSRTEPNTNDIEIVGWSSSLMSDPGDIQVTISILIMKRVD